MNEIFRITNGIRSNIAIEESTNVLIFTIEDPHNPSVATIALSHQEASEMVGALLRIQEVCEFFFEGEE